jgi:hypothetical protein
MTSGAHTDPDELVLAVLWVVLIVLYGIVLPTLTAAAV